MRFLSRLRTAAGAVPVLGRLMPDPAKPELPPWAYRGEAKAYFYYASDEFQIVVLHGLDHHYRMLSAFRPHHHLFIVIPSIESRWQFGFARECLQYFNPGFPLENVTWLCNTEEGVAWARESGWRALHVNHNCWIDESVFRLAPRAGPPDYDMVMNCRPERWKRPELAGEVDRLAVIRGRLHDGAQEWDLAQLDPAYMNLERLAPAGVASVLNRAMCGGIFSAEEGACFSSGEYHLCGLPVVSTPSLGGRDVWYDESNSVICEPSPEAVVAAVDEVREGFRSGRFDREAIRRGFLARSTTMRERFHEVVQSLFESYGVDLDARTHFNDAFRPNMESIVSRRRAHQLLDMGARAFEHQTSRGR